MSIRGMRNRKGIVEAQLTWVFVLIVGAVILLFFIGIAQKQKEIADMKTSANLLQQLDGILTGAEVSSGTASLINIPKMDIEIDCNSFSVEGITKQLKTRIVFAPDLIKGRQLITYNLDWSVPYRVSNFLYLTSPEVRYILVDDTGTLAEELNESLPEIMNKEIYRSGDIFLQDKGNYKVRFIFLDKSQSSITSNLARAREWEGEISAINIKEDGTIDFYNSSGSSYANEDFTGKAQKIGAVFAENAAQYECAKIKAKEKLEIVTEIYQDRLIELNKTISDSTCKNLLAYTLPGLTDIIGVETRNNALQLQSCPTIY